MRGRLQREVDSYVKSIDHHQQLSDTGIVALNEVAIEFQHQAHFAERLRHFYWLKIDVETRYKSDECLDYKTSASPLVNHKPNGYPPRTNVWLVTSVSQRQRSEVGTVLSQNPRDDTGLQSESDSPLLVITDVLSAFTNSSYPVCSTTLPVTMLFSCCFNDMTSVRISTTVSDISRSRLRTSQPCRESEG